MCRDLALVGQNVRTLAKLTSMPELSVCMWGVLIATGKVSTHSIWSRTVDLRSHVCLVFVHLPRKSWSYSQHTLFLVLITTLKETYLSLWSLLLFLHWASSWCLPVFFLCERVSLPCRLAQTRPIGQDSDEKKLHQISFTTCVQPNAS